MTRWLICLFFCAQLSWAVDKHDLFRYDPSQPLNIEEKASEDHAGVTVHDISFNDSTGQSMTAYLAVPQGKGPFAAILYVHWLEDPATSNRTQFLKEAEELAPRGTVSLLVNMPWSTPNWFRTRNMKEDYDFSIRQVQNLRRAIDVLAQRRDVDPKRIAYVGHDFGATYGAVLLGVDSRVRYAVLMAGTPILTDWFLLGAKMEGEERQSFIQKMAPLDPTNFIGKAKSVPLLLQFGTNDKFIAKDKAELFANSARGPKEFRWYEAEHGLNSQAATERMAWLETKLKLAPTAPGN